MPPTKPSRRACLSLNAALLSRIWLALFSPLKHALFPNLRLRPTNAFAETLPLFRQTKRYSHFSKCRVPVFTACFLSTQEPVQRPPHAHGRQAERGGGQQVAGRSAGATQHARTPQEQGRRRKLYPSYSTSCDDFADCVCTAAGFQYVTFRTRQKVVKLHGASLKKQNKKTKLPAP